MNFIAIYVTVCLVWIRDVTVSWCLYVWISYLTVCWCLYVWISDVSCNSVLNVCIGRGHSTSGTKGAYCRCIGVMCSTGENQIEPCCWCHKSGRVEEQHRHGMSNTGVFLVVCWLFWAILLILSSAEVAVLVDQSCDMVLDSLNLHVYMSFVLIRLYWSSDWYTVCISYNYRLQFIINSVFNIWSETVEINWCPQTCMQQT